MNLSTKINKSCYRISPKIVKLFRNKVSKLINETISKLRAARDNKYLPNVIYQGYLWDYYFGNYTTNDGKFYLNHYNFQPEAIIELIKLCQLGFKNIIDDLQLGFCRTDSFKTRRFNCNNTIDDLKKLHHMIMN